MACKGCTCSTAKAGDTVAGCGSNGCSSGGCNRMNTYDWLTALDIEDFDGFDTVEISFKNGSRKEFFKNPSATRATTGDMVLVEADNNGYDVGRISLSGELVRAQMKKRGTKENAILPSVIRKANERDLERLQEARDAEKPTMVQARAIARSLNLDMKIGDVEYQGDKRKATFFYTADGRVDFRELIREFAKEFKVKIEMRQIGARQESARIGGLGPCGRELCCSTWLTDFKSVSTTAARYQNLAINQSKLSGQCGRLKCCLNYELDAYMDALEHFPTRADKIYTEEGSAVLMKTDIFKGLMFYCYEKDHGRGKFYPLEIEQVKDVIAMNKAGQKPTDLSSLQVIEEEEEEVGFDGDLTGVVELPSDRKKKKKKKKKTEVARKEDNRERPKNTFKPRREQKDDDATNNSTQKSEGNTERQQQQPRREHNNQPSGKNEERRREQQDRPANRDFKDRRPNKPQQTAPKTEDGDKSTTPQNNGGDKQNQRPNNKHKKGNQFREPREQNTNTDARVPIDNNTKPPVDNSNNDTVSPQSPPPTTGNNGDPQKKFKNNKWKHKNNKNKGNGDRKPDNTDKKE